MIYLLFVLAALFVLDNITTHFRLKEGHRELFPLTRFYYKLGFFWGFVIFLCVKVALLYLLWKIHSVVLVLILSVVFLIYVSNNLGVFRVKNT